MKKTSAVEHWHGERWREPAEVAGPEIRPECGQARARRDDAEHDAERRAGDTDDRAAEQDRGELLPHRQAHRVQKRDLAPAPGDHQHLRGVDEKRAGEQGDQRECRQVRAIGTRQAQRVVARLPRCQEPRPGRQDGGNRAARGRQVAARHEPQVDAIHAAEPREALLRLRDVEHADLLTKGAGRQQASHPQALYLESDLDAELVALFVSSSASAAAGLSQTESSASIPVVRTAVAPSGASGACSSRTRNGSMPSSCSVRPRSGRRARTSTTGLATATIGSFASVG